MNRSNPAEDFSQIKKQLRELDRQIPVPFAATAKGMKDRLTSPAAAKPFLSHKLAWSAASLLLVAFIGYVLWSPLSSLVATNDSSASNGVQIETAQGTFDTNGISPYALPEDDKAGAQSTASSALRGTSDGNVSNFSEKNSIYYPAENYGQIQLALSTIPSSDSSQSAHPQSSDSGFLPGADYSTSMADQVHQYTLTCTPEGAARLEIRRVSDGTLLSCTDLDLYPRHAVCGRSNTAAGRRMSGGDTVAAFRYFRSIQPRFTAHADPERRLSGRLESRGSPAGQLPISSRRHLGFHSRRL